MTDRSWAVQDKAGKVDLEALSAGDWFQQTKGKEFPVYAKMDSVFFHAEVVNKIIDKANMKLQNFIKRNASLKGAMIQIDIEDVQFEETILYVDIASGRIGALPKNHLVYEVTEAEVNLLFE